MSVIELALCYKHEVKVPEDFGTLEERVARGASLLDAIYPGWEWMINVHELNLFEPEHQRIPLRSGCGCIGAQLSAVGEYGKFVRKVVWPGQGLGSTDTRTDLAVACGFQVVNDQVRQYKILTGLWLLEIAMRTGGHPSCHREPWNAYDEEWDWCAPCEVQLDSCCVPRGTVWHVLIGEVDSRCEPGLVCL